MSVCGALRSNLKIWAIAMHGSNESSNFFKQLVTFSTAFPTRGPALRAYILMRK